MTPPQKAINSSSTRRNRLIREHIHDPYRRRYKLAGPAVCPECGVVFNKGRWQWDTAPEGAQEAMCPACQRVQDKCPGGYLSLRGPFFQEHREEILNLVRNVEAREKALHPLRRMMALEDQDDGVLITTTEAPMARTLGDAVNQAYQGSLDYQYTGGSSLLEVRWER